MAIEVIRALIQMVSSQLLESKGVLVPNTEGPLSLERFSDYIIFECIHRGWDLCFPPKSMHAHISEYTGGIITDDEKMRHSRMIKKLEGYREKDRTKLKATLNVDPPELRKKVFKTPEQKHEGRKLSTLNFHEILTREQVDLLKHIEGKSVCNNRHFSNKRLSAELENYKEYFDQRFSEAKKPEERILASLNLFNVEEHYNIEFLWALAVEINRQKIEDIPFQEIRLLCGRQVLENGLMTDSRFVKERLELIPLLFDVKHWQGEYRNRVYYMLSTKVRLFRQQMFENVNLVQFFLNHTQPDEWADFISEHYSVQNLIQEKM